MIDISESNDLAHRKCTGGGKENQGHTAPSGGVRGGASAPEKSRAAPPLTSVRPFRFWADKAAIAADFHSGNGACYHEKRRIASTASVCTLAKSGVERPGFPCRIASKSGEYPHRSLPFWQAMHGGTHFSLPANCETHLASNARVYTPVQSCWGNAPNP